MKPTHRPFLVLLCLPFSLNAETVAPPSSPTTQVVEDILSESAESADPFAAPSPVAALPEVNPARAAEKAGLPC